MKKILITGLVFLSVFLIYLANMDRKVYYLSLGNDNYSKYIKIFLGNKLERYVPNYAGNKRITDIMMEINNNKKVVNNGDVITLKNALIKADLVTIRIDGKDIYEKINSVDNYNEVYDYIDDLNSDLDKLFQLIRQYCKEDIIMVGYANPFINLKSKDINDVMDYLNRRYKETAQKYNIKYVQINSLNGKKIGNKVVKVAAKSLFEG